MSQGISRRDFIKLVTAGTGTFVLTSSGLVPVPEELAGLSEALAAQAGTFPREETLITRILIGRSRSHGGFGKGRGIEQSIVMMQ